MLLSKIPIMEENGRKWLGKQSKCSKLAPESWESSRNVPICLKMSQNDPKCQTQTHRCPNGLVKEDLHNKDPQKIPALQLAALKNNRIVKMERGHTSDIRHPLSDRIVNSVVDKKPSYTVNTIEINLVEPCGFVQYCSHITHCYKWRQCTRQCTTLCTTLHNAVHNDMHYSHHIHDNRSNVLGKI